MRNLSLSLFLLMIISGCNGPAGDGPYMFISGLTQGTSYHITYQSPSPDSLQLQEKIDALLARFDQSLSTYIDTSNISRLNNNETDVVDDYFTEVFNESKRIYELSDGAFDITVGPLIDAWGFGPGRKLKIDQEVIDSILQFVGMDKVEVIDGKLVKSLPGIRIDLNAIAQGYSVDLLADFLEDQDIENYMVEVGGEIRVQGLSPRGDNWKIGVDKPYFGNQLPGQSLQKVIQLSDHSLASSGNYRKYYEQDGKKIVHTVDPKTGYTRMSNLLSVTIITEECITADGLATACMSLGLKKARKFITSIDDVEGFFIYADDDGVFYEWMSEGMNDLID